MRKKRLELRTGFEAVRLTKGIELVKLEAVRSAKVAGSALSNGRVKTAVVSSDWAAQKTCVDG